MSCDAQKLDHFGILAKSNNEFAKDLYRLLASDEENLFFSSLSIHVALILTYIGARGKTAEELKNHLHLPDNKDDLLNGIHQLLTVLKNPKLNVATEIFIENSYNVKSEYKQNAKKFLESESRNIDFKKSPSAAEKLINDWVSSQTNNKITDLIPPGTLNEYTRLVLVNAIHFKDDWAKKFEKSNSCKQKFYTTENNFSDIDMMHQTSKFRFMKNDQFKALELPYEDQNFKMVIFLPNEINGLSNLEKFLLNTDLSKVLNGMTMVKVKVTLPKFKFEKITDLNDVLKKIGIQTMFDEKKADFSDIYETTENPLFVSNVLHKAFVEVNEKGTEAAAATMVGMRCRRSLPMPEEVHEFLADRPFTFQIRCANNILFYGKFVGK